MVQITRQQRRSRCLTSTNLVVVLLLFVASLMIAASLLSFRRDNNDAPATLSNRHFAAVFPTLTCDDRDNDRHRYGCVVRPAELDDRVRRELSSDPDVSMWRYGQLPHAAALTQQGKDHAVNQDRGTIVAPFRLSNAEVQYSYGSAKDFFVGIYDGHGDLGHEVARFLQENVHKRLEYKLSRSRNVHELSSALVEDALRSTFLELDRELPPLDSSSDDDHHYNVGENGGSTASVVLRFGDRLFFANVGDSTSFLGRYDRATRSTTIVHRTRADKPHLPEEKRRIESLNGRVRVPPHPENSRVLAFDLVRNEQMSLAMSRSIGDNPHTRIGVVAEPIVESVDLSSYDRGELFVASASDGVFDHRRPQYVAERLAESHFAVSTNDADAERRPPLVVGVANLIDDATPKEPHRYRDDITVLSVRVEL